MHGTAVPWKPQEMSGLIVQPFSEVLLCRHEIKFVLLHWRQHTQIALHTAVIVVSDVVLNHGYKFLTACEAPAIIPFPFENAPEAFHWPVVDAFGHPGHTLLHLGCFQLVIEHPVGILETSVTMEYRFSIRVSLDCFRKGI